jgi:hypothetical protein
MATFWSFAMGDSAAGCLRLVVAAACIAAMGSNPAPLTAKEKRHRHPAGFSFELSNGWTVENGAEAALLVPRGVSVDPNREDNPEIYTVRTSPVGTTAGEKELIAGLRETLVSQGVKLEQDPRPEGFGRRGSIYTFDFVHPARKAAFRIRVFSMQSKGRTIALIASGLRDRVASRDKALRDMAASLDYDR